MIIDIVKMAVGSAASIGSGVFVGEALKKLTPDNLGKVKKACSIVGGVMIGGIVSKAATNQAEEMVDETVGIIVKVKTKLSRNK